MGQVELVVEQAGCSSCATRVRRALEPLATVETIEVDESADVATVRLRSADALGHAAVEAALRDASGGSGHEYRVQPGSWREVAA